MAYNDLFNWMQPQADDYAHGQIDSEIDVYSWIAIPTWVIEADKEEVGS